MPTSIRTIVMLEVLHEKPVDELELKIAGRAYTIEGVTDCNVIVDPELAPGTYKYRPVMREARPVKTTLWQRIKAWFAE